MTGNAGQKGSVLYPELKQSLARYRFAVAGTSELMPAEKGRDGFVFRFSFLGFWIFVFWEARARCKDGILTSFFCCLPPPPDD